MEESFSDCSMNTSILSEALLNDSHMGNNSLLTHELDITEPTDNDLTLNSFSEKDATPVYLGIEDKSLFSQVEVFKLLCQQVTNARRKYCASALVVITMDEVFSSTSTSSTLSEDLKETCSDKLRFHQVLSKLEGISEMNDIFDFGDNSSLETRQLTSEETKSVHFAMMEAVTAKCSQLMKCISVEQLNSENLLMIPGSLFIEEEVYLLRRINELATLMNCCAENTNNTVHLLDELYKARVTKICTWHKEQMEKLRCGTKTLAINLKCFNESIDNFLITQDGVVEAVYFLEKELQIHLREEEYSLQKARNLKESYDQLRGTRYEEILSKYTDLRENLKHKSWALQKMSRSSRPAISFNSSSM